MTESRGGVKGLCLALGLVWSSAAMAETAPAAFPADLAPCLAASADAAEFRASFAAAGWAEAQGDGRETALNALAETRHMLAISPDISTPEKYARFVEIAHAARDKHIEWDLVMLRDGLSLGIDLLELPYDNGIRVECLVTGTAYPEVDAALRRPGARLADPKKSGGGGTMLSTLSIMFEEPTIPGYQGLTVGWVRLDLPFVPVPAPLASHSIFVSYSFSTDAPPVPPPATNP